MKKLILIVAMLLTTILGYSQCMLGYTEYAIKKEKPRDKFTVNYSDYGVRYITYENAEKNLMWAYYFGKDGYVSESLLIPIHRGDHMKVISLYNDNYTIESPGIWLTYINGLAVRITLNWKYESDIYYFTFKYL